MSSSPASSSLGYEPALDGLRAVAVLAVMLYHSGAGVPGGFLGVDLFFVLSGYLITTLMLREVAATGGLGIRDFYVRRLRRLAPALLLLLLGVGLYSRFRVAPIFTISIRRDAVATLEYWANWRFITSKQSYFAAFMVPSPLRHVWSLSVEEQWYLVWPVVLVALLRITRHRVEVVLGAVVVLAVASAAWMSHLVQPLADPSRAYYGSDTRAHTILVGSALALALHRWPLTRPPAQRAVRWVAIGAFGVCLAAFAVVRGVDRWLYHGGYLGFAAVGALVIAGLMAGGAGGALKRVLCVPPLPWIGRISYGLYLWHWLVDVWLTPQYLRRGFLFTFTLRWVVAFALATVSYHLVERPIRTAAWGRLRAPRLATLAAGAVAFGLVAGGVMWLTRPRTPPAAAASTAVPPPELATDLKVLVVGDSVGWSLAFGVPKQPGLKLSDAAIIGCGVLPGDLYEDGVEVHQTGAPPCETAPKLRDAALERRPDVVVMTFGAWEVFDHIVDGHRIPVHSDAYRDLLTRKLTADVDAIASRTTAPIVILDAPCMHQNDYDLGAEPSPRNDAGRVAVVNDALRRVARSRRDRVTVLPWSRWLCPGGRFLQRRGGVVLRPDGVHLDQRTSAPLLWAWLKPQLWAVVTASGGRTPDTPAPSP